jgi:hypothetical protein
MRVVKRVLEHLLGPSIVGTGRRSSLLNEIACPL